MSNHRSIAFCCVFLLLLLSSVLAVLPPSSPVIRAGQRETNGDDDSDLSVFAVSSATFEGSPAAQAFAHLCLLLEEELRHGVSGTDKDYGRVLAADVVYYNQEKGKCAGLVKVAACLLDERSADYELFPKAHRSMEVVSHKDIHVVIITTKIVDSETQHMRCFIDGYLVYTGARTPVVRMPLITRILRWPRITDPVWGCRGKDT